MEFIQKTKKEEDELQQSYLSKAQEDFEKNEDFEQIK